MWWRCSVDTNERHEEIEFTLLRKESNWGDKEHGRRKKGRDYKSNKCIVTFQEAVQKLLQVLLIKKKYFKKIV